MKGDDKHPLHGECIGGLTVILSKRLAHTYDNRNEQNRYVGTACKHVIILQVRKMVFWQTPKVV